MLISEFIERTGFRPTEEYYHEVIEREYNDSKLDKDAWCKQWKKQGGIQKAYDAKCEQSDKEYAQVLTHEETIRLQKSEIDDLREDIADYKGGWERVGYLEEKAKQEKAAMVEFLIAQAEKWGATDLREKVIEMIGTKAYLRYKITHNLNLWDADKELLSEILE